MKAFTGNRSGLAIALVCVAQFVIVLDVTVVTSALPALGRELGFGADDLQWVVTAYVLAFGGFLVAGGRAADLIGARRAFTIGLAGFAAASLGCGLAPTGWVLIASRVLQGLAAALLTPAALALLNAVTEPGAARRRAVGIWTAAAAGGGASGWVLGGLLTEYAGWRWVFLINVPIGVVGLSVVALVLPRVAPEAARRLDLLGAVGLTGGLSLVVYGLSEAAAADPDLRLVTATLLAGGSADRRHPRVRAPDRRCPAAARPAAAAGRTRSQPAGRRPDGQHQPGDVRGRALRAGRAAAQPGAGGLAVPGAQPDRHRRARWPDRP